MFKEVATLDADKVTALGGKDKKSGKVNPKNAEGYYLGSRKVENKKSKSGYVYIHYLQTDKGNLGIWGKTDLDRKITSVTPGTMVRITQTGMQPTPNGDMYKFKVEVDVENTIDVDLSTENTVSNEEDAEQEETEEYEEEPEEQEVEEQLPARAASAAKQSEVNAILKRRTVNR